MRRPSARYAGFIALAAGISACAPSAERRAPDVRVTITCTRVRVNVTIGGWVVHQNPSGQVRLQLVAGANVASINVVPKDATSWPFTPPPPYVVPSGGQQILTVNSSAQPGTYSYNIVGTCTPTDGPAQSVTIDPDIVVD